MLESLKNILKKIKNIEKKDLMIIILLGILSLILMSMTFFYSTDPLNMELFLSYFRGRWLMMMNFIPIFLTMALLSLIFNQVWLGFGITSIILLIMSLVNKFKLRFRDEAFNFIDISLISESMDMAGKYPISLDRYMIVTIILIPIITLLLRKFIKYKIDSSKLRMGLLILILVISTLIFKGFYFNPHIYDRVGDKDLINIWSQTQQFQVRGLVYPFIYSITDLKDIDLEGYDEDLARDIIENRTYSNIPEDQKVNIISIMLEAYNDFSKFENVKLNIDIYENFHRIQEESYRGNLVTNVFAGGTINTEWGFLTGYNSHPKYIKNTKSFIRYFNQEGYKTEAMHPIYGWFYNRRNINDYLGFHNFDYYENKYEKIQEEYLKDIDFFDYIIKGYEESKRENKPYFNFSVTYQNHGPYSVEKLTDEDYLKRQSHHDEMTYNIINNYFHGLNQTDQALKKLVDYFKEDLDPTILIIFGDHNPWLGEDNIGYEMLGIDVDTSSLEGFLNYYQTPYLIWGNPKAKEVLKREFNREGNTISPNFLMAEVFQYLGWKGNQYMDYISYVKDNFDVNHEMYFKEDGKFTRHLSKERAQIWQEFNYVQYYYSRTFIDDKNH